MQADDNNTSHGAREMKITKLKSFSDRADAEKMLKGLRALLAEMKCFDMDITISHSRSLDVYSVNKVEFK